ncbi:hypothetical protein ACH46_13875 [Gordonia phthalatica]|uniref:Uncharacterized protein n=1 Tax=Gordonia phthalatica TaxID=1136941 RepID=A0A0N9MSB0_9ACTN|nr:hypothetical protein ACH46_13875 [Gordonia phthalatica]
MTLSDLAVKARRLQESLFTSKGHNVTAFGARVARVQNEQHASLTYVNATQSDINRWELEAEMERIVEHGDSRYIRIIGSGYDREIGRR